MENNYPDMDLRDCSWTETKNKLDVVSSIIIDGDGKCIIRTHTRKELAIQEIKWQPFFGEIK